MYIHNKQHLNEIEPLTRKHNLKYQDTPYYNQYLTSTRIWQAYMTCSVKLPTNLPELKPE